MADLSSMYRSMIESIPNPADWEKSYQQRAAGRMELMEKQRQINDEQRLRELFARNASPNISEIGAISPQFAQTFGKNQMEMLQANMGMQNIQSQINEREYKRAYEQSKIRANALAPIAEQYTFDVQSMGEPQAREKYNRTIGDMLALLESQGIPIPANFDPKVATPKEVLNSAIGFGYKSPLMQQQYELGTERGKRELPSVYTTPQGTSLVPGIPTMQPAEIPQGAQQMPLRDTDYAALEKLYSTLPFGSFKDEVGKLLASRGQAQATTPTRPAAMPPAQFTTLEAIEQKRIKSKVDEETATKQAAQKLEDQKAIDSYFRGRPPEQIRQLIRESIAGDVESGVARIAKTFGVSVPGGSATAALKTITQQLIEGSPYAPGSQSNVEYIARLEKIGNPASDEPIKDRLAALDEFLRERQAFIANKAELSQEELIDAVANGYIDKESALKIRKRTLAKAGAPQ